MIRYNRTNFTSDGFAKRLLEAMCEAFETGLPVYMDNRQGRRWLRVRIVELTPNRFTYDFWTHYGQEVGHLVLQGAFEWSPELSSRFAKMVAHLATMPKHPYEAAEERRELAEWAAKEEARKEKAAKEREELQHKIAVNKLQREKAHNEARRKEGITHYVPAYGYGYWRKGWLWDTFVVLELRSHFPDLGRRGRHVHHEFRWVPKHLGEAI